MSSVHTVNAYRVDKLTSGNFSVWKFRIQMVLKARKLWKYVENPCVGLDEKEQEKEQEGLSQIALTVSDSVIGHIRHCKTAHDAWSKICSVFEQKGLASQIFLRRKLFNIKFNEAESMQAHINKIREISDHLEAIGDPVKDRDLAIISLCTLPERYNSLIISLEARLPEDISFDVVTGRLLAEEERQKESSEPTPDGERAFYAGKNGTAARLRGQRSSKQCEFCKRTGHTVESCWDKHGRPNDRDGTGNKYAKTAQDREQASAVF